MTPNSSSRARASSASISATSASIAAYTPTASPSSAGTSVPSSRLAITISGFRVRGAMPLSSAMCSVASFASRSGVSASSAVFAASSASTSIPGFPRAFFTAFVERRLDHGQVGQQQVRPHVGHLRGRRRVGAEAPDDHRERLDFAELRDRLRARQPAGHVHEPDLGRDRLLRTLEVRQHLQARIGHRDDGHVRLPAVRTGVGERREQRGLPGEAAPTSPMSFTVGHGSSGLSSRRGPTGPAMSAERRTRTDF